MPKTNWLILFIASSTLLLGGCGGGSSAVVTNSTPSSTFTLSGVAAVGAPIAGADVSIICSTGSARSFTTNISGAWSDTLPAQTLPCAVEVSNGTVNGIANTMSYHSIATTPGTVNITPLTDLLVANLVGSATPGTWFAGLRTTSSPLAAISQSNVDTAIAKLRAAFPALSSLAAINPITTPFTATSGNVSDDTLTALATAMTSTGITHASLLSNASATTFNAPASLGTALTTAYTGTLSGGGSGATSYTVGGTVTGLNGKMTLQNNYGDNRAVDANGNFTFATPVSNGGSYSVTVLSQPADQTCSVSTGAGRVSGSNVTNVTVVCANNSYSVGGTVSGLTGSVVLQDNKGDNPTISANGTFTLASKVANGSPYSVTVLVHPAGQSCSVSNGNGTITSANVTNVAITCATDTYVIGAAVTGLSGSMVLQNNGGDNLPVSTNGNISFPTTLVFGSTYNVTVLNQPAGQTCSVSTGAGTVSGNVTNVAVACSTNSYTVGGSVTGLAGSIVLQNNNGANLTVSSSGFFTFPSKVANGSPYSVTVLTQPASQSCSVANGTGTIALGSVNNVTITCSANTSTIGGTVTGLNGNLVLQDNGGDNLAVAANGSFSFPTTVGYGGAYNVTVQTQPAGQTCSVSSGSGTTSGAKVANVAVVCSTNSYAVGGAVSGLTGSIVLQDNNGDNLTLAANGTLTFATKVASGSPYSVTVFTQPPGQSCSVTNGTGTIALANVTNVTVTCVTNTYTIGGTVTGLTGLNMVLQDNGGDNLTVTTNGNFTFATKVASGSPYNVTVLTQPPYASAQTCTVTGGSGTTTAAVSNVMVTCTLNSVPGSVYTVAGNGTLGHSGDNGPATSAQLDGLLGVALDGARNLYILDRNNNLVRKVSAATGIITTVAGNGTLGFSGDGGPATSAQLNSPIGIAADNTGNLYIAENSRIRMVTAATGIISTVAGNGTAGFSGDGGLATAAQFNVPWGVAADGSGNLYIADSINNRIRKVVLSTGIVTTVAGTATSGYSGDGGPATAAQLFVPEGVAVDSAGNLYIADTSNACIRKVTMTTGIITTVAGSGTAGYAGDNALATAAKLNSGIIGIAVDGLGNLYIADINNYRVRKVTTSGTISTLAGYGTAAYSGDGGPATLAQFNALWGIAADSVGNLYIADRTSYRVRKVVAPF